MSILATVDGNSFFFIHHFDWEKAILDVKCNRQRGPLAMRDLPAGSFVLH